MGNEASNSQSVDKAYLLPRNPSALFVCWTWSAARVRAFEAGDYSPEIFVRLTAGDDKNLFSESCVRWDSQKTYIKPPAEGRSFSAAVYGRRRDGSLEKLLESNAAVAPVSAPRQGLTAGYSSAEFFRKQPVDL